MVGVFWGQFYMFWGEIFISLYVCRLPNMGNLLTRPYMGGTDHKWPCTGALRSKILCIYSHSLAQFFTQDLADGKGPWPCLSQQSQAHVQDVAGMLSQVQLLTVLLAHGCCGLHPVTFHQAQYALLLQTRCCMVPPGWPAAFGEFGAFGSELSIVCVSRRHKQIVGNERKVICFNWGISSAVGSAVAVLAERCGKCPRVQTIWWILVWTMGHLGSIYVQWNSSKCIWSVEAKSYTFRQVIPIGKLSAYCA